MVKLLPWPQYIHQGTLHRKQENRVNIGKPAKLMTHAFGLQDLWSIQQMYLEKAMKSWAKNFAGPVQRQDYLIMIGVFCRITWICSLFQLRPLLVHAQIFNRQFNSMETSHLSLVMVCLCFSWIAYLWTGTLSNCGHPPCAPDKWANDKAGTMC